MTGRHPEVRLDLDRIRDEAEQVACPYCQQPAGQTCRNTATGEPLRLLPAHRDRLKGVDI